MRLPPTPAYLSAAESSVRGAGHLTGTRGLGCDHRQLRSSESRTAGIPDTSFAFWRLSGIALYLKWRGRPLIVYVTSARRPLSAQETDEDDKFFLGFAGSAVFPYDPNPLAGLGLARLMALCSKLEIPV